MSPLRLTLALLALSAGAATAQQAPPRPATPPKPPAPRAAPVPFVLPDLDWRVVVPKFELDIARKFQLGLGPELEWGQFDLPGLPELVWHGDPTPFAPQGRRLTLPEPSSSRQQGTPEDSLYRQARQVLNNGEYRRASDLFRLFGERYPRSRYAAASMYWQAFALYRVGTEADLRQALRLLDQQRERHPSAAEDAEVSALLARVVGALAARGDADAARHAREGAAAGLASCDREDMEVRAEALSSLVQADPASATSILERTLARRDECSVPLRRRALYLIGRDGTERHLPTLLEVVRNDPDASVRSDALGRIARLAGEGPVRALEQIITTSTDERTLRSAIQALRQNEQAEVSRILRRALEREDLAEAVRAEAVRSLVRRSVQTAVAQRAVSPSGVVIATTRRETTLDENDAAYLRAMYDKVSSRTVKNTILETLAGAGGSANDQWLMAMIRNQNEDIRFRTTALSRLRRSDVPVGELAGLYDQLTERQLRSTIIGYLGARPEDAATDKLIAIARTGTDPRLRTAAISALTRKAEKDERTLRLLMEIVERP